MSKITNKGMNELRGVYTLNVDDVGGRGTHHRISKGDKINPTSYHHEIFVKEN